MSVASPVACHYMPVGVACPQCCVEYHRAFAVFVRRHQFVASAWLLWIASVVDAACGRVGAMLPSVYDIFRLPDCVALPLWRVDNSCRHVP